MYNLTFNKYLLHLNEVIIKYYNDISKNRWCSVISEYDSTIEKGTREHDYTPVQRNKTKPNNNNKKTYVTH